MSIQRLIVSSVFSGLIMWIVGGLYHNLILPAVSKHIDPHHEGLGITLMAYILLGLLMSYFYMNSKDHRDSLIKGIKTGAIIGILWVFPHGLTMAAVHESSISYQITNALYHVTEQGTGGVIIFLSFRYFGKRQKRIDQKRTTIV